MTPPTSGSCYADSSASIMIGKELVHDTNAEAAQTECLALLNPFKVGFFCEFWYHY